MNTYKRGKWLDYLENKRKKSKKVKKKRSASKRKKRTSNFVYYPKYIKSNAWKRKRELALEFHGRYCRICNSTSSLTVHHLTYDRLGKEDIKTDLTVLCWSCHKEHHEELNSKIK